MSIILECIKSVGRGERGRKPLTFEQAYLVMQQFLNDEIDDDQMAMMMMLIRVNNETAAEIAGFTKAFHQLPYQLKADIDWPCYAGKKSKLSPEGKQQNLPWHLLSAKLLANSGYRVLLHGHLDIGSDRIHCREYLDNLNIPVAANAEHAQLLLDQNFIAYLPLANFSSHAEKMLNWKQRYGLRTPINTVVRGLNPARAKIGLRGSFHPGYQQLHAEIETLLEHDACSVVSFKGTSGEAEYNPKVSQTVWSGSSKQLLSHYWPEQFNPHIATVSHCPLGTIEADKVLMANHVVTTISTVLFAESHNKLQADQQANQLWFQFCES